MNKVIGKRLFSTNGDKPVSVPEYGPTIVDRLIAFIENELAESGDRVFIMEAENLGFKSPHNKKVRLLSEVIPTARRIASVLVNNFNLSIGRCF